jgi:transcriptional regulator GlxA family with amidase domain
MSAFPSHSRRNAANCVPLNEAGTAKSDLAAIETNVDLSPQRTSVEDARLRKLLLLMEEDPLGTIHDWALAFNLSHSHLQHLFKQATGIGLGHALTQKRLERAAHLLENTNMSVKEIACAVGYEHTSSFIRAFERQFETAPRRFRRQKSA